MRASAASVSPEASTRAPTSTSLRSQPLTGVDLILGIDLKLREQPSEAGEVLIL
jgi:hypothetical protein